MTCFVCTSIVYDFFLSRKGVYKKFIISFPNSFVLKNSLAAFRQNDRRAIHAARETFLFFAECLYSDEDGVFSDRRQYRVYGKGGKTPKKEGNLLFVLRGMITSEYP